MSRRTARTETPLRTVTLPMLSMHGAAMLGRITTDGLLVALVDAPVVPAATFGTEIETAAEYAIRPSRLAKRGVYRLPWPVDLGNGKRGTAYVGVDRWGTMATVQVAEPGVRGLSERDVRRYVAEALVGAERVVARRKERAHA